MIRRLVGWLVLLPLCLVLVAFALANRQLVTVNLNPTAPTIAEDAATAGYGVPLFLVIYAVLLVGVLLGGVATWFAQSHHRVEKRRWRRESERLTVDLAAARRAPAVYSDEELVNTP